MFYFILKTEALTFYICERLPYFGPDGVAVQCLILNLKVSVQSPCSCAMHHSCWRASFLGFCLGGRPAIYTIYIPYISFLYSMYIYNYMHIWQAARNVKNPPANSYAIHSILVLHTTVQRLA